MTKSPAFNQYAKKMIAMDELTGAMRRVLRKEHGIIEGAFQMKALKLDEIETACSNALLAKQLNASIAETNRLGAHPGSKDTPPCIVGVDATQKLYFNAQEICNIASGAELQPKLSLAQQMLVIKAVETAPDHAAIVKPRQTTTLNTRY